MLSSALMLEMFKLLNIVFLNLVHYEIFVSPEKYNLIC